MTNRPTDPRRLGGRVLNSDEAAKPGHTPVDIRNAVITDCSQVMKLVLFDIGTEPAPVLGMLLGGVINTAQGPTDERAEVLYLMHGQGAATLVAQLIALAHSLGAQFEQAFTASVRLLLAENVPGRRPYDG